MATLNIPNTFTNATIANANEVNGNFSAVKTFVEGSLVQADGSVKAGTAAINDGAITTAKIADSAVTEGKIATDAVTAAKMADASVALNTATVTGTLPLANGGTNATTALGAITNIGAYGKGTGAPAGFRITVSATEPAGAANGDIWLKP